MSQTPMSTEGRSFLCERGLLKAGALIEFVASWEQAKPRPARITGLDAEIVRRDDVLMREVFNAKVMPLQSADPVARAVETASRESTLLPVFRLYVAGQQATPAVLRRGLYASELEATFAALTRLTCANGIDVGAAVAHAEQQAAADDDLLAHVMDPLQLRYVLSYHSTGVREQVGAERLRILSSATEASDRNCLRALFDDLLPYLSVISKDAPQLFRSVLLEFWRKGRGDLAGLAYEIAILDSRLFGDAGWESTRLFCAMLRRITSPGSEVLDAFLSDEEIDTCLLASEALRQDELISHFRRLATSYNTKRHRDLYRSVTYLARERSSRQRETPAAESVQPWAAAPASAPQGV